jgi:hypothetical protein
VLCSFYHTQVLLTLTVFCVYVLKPSCAYSTPAAVPLLLVVLDVAMHRDTADLTNTATTNCALTTALHYTLHFACVSCLHSAPCGTVTVNGTPLPYLCSNTDTCSDAATKTCPACDLGGGATTLFKPCTTARSSYNFVTGFCGE